MLICSSLSLALFQNLQKKKAEQIQRKAFVQELEEKQLKRMRPSNSLAPRSSLTSYGTSDDDVFYEPVSEAELLLPQSLYKGRLQQMYKKKGF